MSEDIEAFFTYSYFKRPLHHSEHDENLHAVCIN